ncbi:hypothetical protein GPJ56_003622 [Histomonas meleagridis]|uniref:uncharacterized protein n=1 Tax=Histomonas meleagridis TaxID=135588 RepID=UPI00355A9A34|nr:hypothetical protein GPJ56_003622 [Histomonas meleagridis]KAH0800692.1 hypothetical protein GO595_006445 [Histomonas meleagridis]
MCIKGRGTKGQEIPVFLTVGHNEFEVYNKNWETCYHSFQTSDGKVEMDKSGLLRITYSKPKEQQKQTFDFTISFDRPDLIINIFSGSNEGRKQSSSMNIIDLPEVLSFSCGLPRNIAVDKFKPLLEAQAQKRVRFLTSSNKISHALISSIAIEFRMRFPQIEPENWNEAFDILWFEFVAFIVSLWTQILKIAIEPHTGPNSFDYFQRLAASISSIIAKGADVFQVDRRSFLISARKYLDTGDYTTLPTASRKIVSDVELALGNVRKRWLLQLIDLFEYTQIFSVAIAIAQSVADDTKEGSSLSNMLASWAVSLSTNQTRGPRQSDFMNALEKLAVAVLQANDSKRYHPEFHCVLALWKLHELVKSSD